MLIPSVTILLVLFLMMIVFIRSKKFDYVVGILPLYLIPLAYIVSEIPSLESPLLGLSHSELGVSILSAALLVAEIAVVVLAFRFFRNTLIRKVYIFSAGGFILVLSGIFIFHHLGSLIN